MVTAQVTHVHIVCGAMIRVTHGHVVCGALTTQVTHVHVVHGAVTTQVTHVHRTLEQHVISPSSAPPISHTVNPSVTFLSLFLPERTLSSSAFLLPLSLLILKAIVQKPYLQNN